MSGNIDVRFVLKELESLRLERDTLKGEKGSGGGNPPGGDGLEKRIEKIESALPDIREKLIRVETKVDSIEKHGSTKADLSSMESTLIKWFVATAFAMTALASGITFGIARMLAQ